YEHGLFGAEGRGLYAGVGAFGLHAQVAQNGGASWGFEEEFYYQLRNDGIDPETGKAQKFVGWKLGPFDIWYDHANRNDNQPNFKNKEEFEEYAVAQGLDYGEYPKFASKFHNSEKNDKMWMGRKSVFSFLYGWFLIPSVEGVFNKETGKVDPGSASYNYGSNWISHGLLDILPWKMMDVWFPNP
ncbi:MAG: hypothetical protein HUK21_04795, partial [Fibrobacteraceae bacterium]|nr:hypothetical protein [Fibrobacteraceae bacterium]